MARAASTFFRSLCNLILLIAGFIASLFGGGRRDFHDALARNPGDGIRLRGFTRIQILDPDGTIVGDSGLVENKVMNYCCNNLASLLCGAAGTNTIAYMALGSSSNTYAAGTAAGTVTNLVGELAFAGANSTQVGRFTVATAVGTYTNTVGVQFTASFTSGTNFINSATTVTINNCALLASSSAGTVFLNNTFGTSQLASNQAVQATWTLTLAN